MSNNAWSNDSITTLTIPTGATSGGRIVIGLDVHRNPAILVYDTGGHLVGQWAGTTPNGTPTSCLFDYDPASTDYAEICSAQLIFSDTAHPPFNVGRVTGSVSSISTGILEIDSGLSVNTNEQAQLQLREGTVGNSLAAVTQRGVAGFAVSTSNGSLNNVFNVFHAATTVVDLGGGFLGARFPHAAGFVPTGQIIVPYDGPSVTQLFTFNQESATIADATVSVRHADGTAAVVGENTECFGILFK